MEWQGFWQLTSNGNAAQNATTLSAIQVRPKARVTCNQIPSSVEVSRCGAVLLPKVFAYDIHQRPEEAQQQVFGPEAHGPSLR